MQRAEDEITKQELDRAVSIVGKLSENYKSKVVGQPNLG